ncbi:MAG: hypothetical protein ACYCYK_14060 [Candidatus Dormibacteria bacterium]
MSRRAGRRTGRWLGRQGAAALITAAAVIGLGLLPVSAAVTNPFPSGSSGFDVSYPNCTSQLPSGDSFAIVGATGGRPFTTYGCLKNLWKNAAKVTGGSTPSLYFNTGYSGAYGRDISSTACTGSAVPTTLFSTLTGHQLKQAQQAWEIGCSEADYAMGLAPATPTMWFADIETGNSWSNNVTLNQFTIDGLSWAMANLGTPYLGGIYSSATMWSTITGSTSWSPTPHVAANWATGAGTKCPTSSPFDTASPTWVLQGAAQKGVDTDTGC